MANMISNNNFSSKTNGLVIGEEPISASSSTSSMPTTNAPNSVGLVNKAGENGSVGEISVVPANEADIRNYLQPISSKIPLASDVCSYDHIIEMIRSLDLEDDIKMNKKIKSIETYFCNIVRDENMLRESIEYINNKALEDGETTLKFALVFSSRNFDVLAMKENNVRMVMLTNLEKNFINAEIYRVNDRERLYNSITLLGEYYHRVRLTDNSPINILGESLLKLLIEEIKEEKHMNDIKLAKLIFSQITRNGNLLRNVHRKEISQLLYHIRKNLIEQPNLKPTIKAIMLMILDLFNNFASLGSQLKKMYIKYYTMEDDDEGDTNQNQEQSPEVHHQHHHQQQHNQCNNNDQEQNDTCSSTQFQQQNQCDNNDQEQNDTCYSTQFEQQNHSYNKENGDSGNVNDNTEDDPDNYRKWSKQVCEDSFEEKNGVESDLNINGSLNPNSLNKNYTDDYEQQQHSYNSRYNTNSSYKKSRNSKRSFQQNFTGNGALQNKYNSQNSVNEEHGELKPLPRWRITKFNRNNQQKENRSYNAQRRPNTSDGDTIRLYTMNDRLKHFQGKI